MNRSLTIVVFSLAVAVAVHATTIINGPAYFGAPELPMTQPLFAPAAITTASNVSGPLVGQLTTVSAATETMMPYNGTISKLRFDVDVAPGTGGSSKSWTATLYKNGVATALTCQIFETATQAEDLVNTVSYTRGEKLRWIITGSGTPAAAYHQLSALSISRAAADSVVTFGNGSGTLSKTVASSFAINTIGAANANGSVIMPTSGTFDRLYANFQSTDSGVMAVSLRVNGVNSALTCTLTSASVSASNDANSVHVNAGDVVQIYGDPTTALSGNKYLTGSLRFKPDINGESFVVTANVAPNNANATRYYALNAAAGGNTVTTATARVKSGRAPIAFTLKKLWLFSNTAPSPGNYTVKSFKNAGLGSLSAQITAANTSASDIVNSDSVALSDLLYFQVVSAGSPVSSSISASAVVYVAP